ncbi:WxL domain-containing protein [Listeria aquatica]|uniref:WxL domain-containing protein n=1 Tax=Listeria aquatica TaxID=1494960 RepID=UPI003F7196BC
MNKLSRKVIGGTLLSATALFGFGQPGNVLAADVATYNSNGIVEFTPNTDVTPPVDPNDPDPNNPVEPVDPTDPNGPDPGTPGPLSIDYASSVDFGKMKITSTDQVYNAAAQKFSGGSVADGPNYVQVTDSRGGAKGWQLRVQQDDQFTSTSGKELTGAELSFNNGVVNSSSDSPKPTGTASFTLVPGDGSTSGPAEIVMDAATGQGDGTQVLAFGNDATKAESIKLSVPGETSKVAEVYTTSLTWTLADLPVNP